MVGFVTELSAGFRLLSDLSAVEFLEKDCDKEIARAMELFDEKGVSLVVRVIPDPSKDIGLKILALFHYADLPQTVTCANMVEAAKALEL
jgi:hypothetical protein